MPLWSETLGLAGRADVVEIGQEGEVAPVEYKSGVRHGETADLQLCAQGLCLEEMLGVDVPVGYVWYGGPRCRHRVELSAALRRTTIEAIDMIRSTIESGTLPGPIHDERCQTCQLRPQCLPDLLVRHHAVERYLRHLFRP